MYSPFYADKPRVRQKLRTTQLGFLSGRYRSLNFVTEAGLADIEASCRAPREGDRSAAAAAPLRWGAARERGSRQNFRLQQGVLDTTVTLRRDDGREERFKDRGRR